MEYRIFLGTSSALQKRWLVKALNVEGATGKVLTHCKALLLDLENNNPSKDLNIDLKFIEIKEDVFELNDNIN